MSNRKLLLIMAALSLGSIAFFALRVAIGPSPEPLAAAPQPQSAPVAIAPPTPVAAAEQPAAAPAPSEAAAESEVPRVVLAQSSDTAPNPLEGWVEGKNYTRLTPTQPTSSSPDQVEVTEVFWYGCPHCFNFDPYVEKWLQTKPSYISFVRIPAVWNPLLQIHARAFYTAEALGKGAEMHESFFREIHINGNSLSTEAALQEFFGRFGVDATTFKNTFDSFSVHAKLQRADELARRYKISSVPSIVVNGKYVTNATMAGGYDRLMELIDALAASEESGA